MFFLREVENVQLELFDTAGLGEAGASHVVSQSELAVKDMCAFVLMLNVQFLKTEVESKLPSNLGKFHLKLFSKLKRILNLIRLYFRRGVVAEGLGTRLVAFAVKRIC